MLSTKIILKRFLRLCSSLKYAELGICDFHILNDPRLQEIEERESNMTHSNLKLWVPGVFFYTIPNGQKTAEETGRFKVLRYFIILIYSCFLR